MHIPKTKSLENVGTKKISKNRACGCVEMSDLNGWEVIMCLMLFGIDCTEMEDNRQLLPFDQVCKTVS